VAAGEPASSAQDQKEATAGMLGWPGGQWLVALTGAAIVAVAGVIVWYGLTRQFERKLKVAQMSRAVHKGAVAAGQIGYLTKGAGYATIGILFVVSAVTYSPERSAGLDGGLRTLAAEPFGPLLLWLIALGFAAFGVYCFVQSRYQKV
jgi:hypothetical protein